MCPKCNKEMVVDEDDADPNDRRIKFMNETEDVSSFVQIVDGRRWDGLDFFGGTYEWHLKLRNSFR